MSQHTSFPAYVEKREIECQTDIEDDFFVADGDDLADEVEDGLYGLLTLPQGFHLNKSDTAGNLSTDSQVNPSGLKKNEFTISSRRLLHNTKVLTPSKFAGDPEEVVNLQVYSRNISKTGSNVSEKIRKIICKKPPDIVYDFGNLSNSPLTVQNLNLTNAKSFGLPEVQNLNQISVLDHTNLAKESLNEQHLYSITGNCNRHTQPQSAPGSVQMIQLNQDVQVIQNPIDNAIQKTPATCSHNDLSFNVIQIPKNVITDKNLRKILPKTSNASPLKAASGNVILHKINVESQPAIQNKNRGLLQAAVQVHASPEGSLHEPVQIHPTELNPVQLNPAEESNMQVSPTKHESVHVIAVKQIPLQESAANLSHFQVNSEIQSPLQVNPTTKSTLQVTSKKEESVHVGPKQKMPILDLRKLKETLKNQGKDLNTLNSLISNTNGEILVNGQPLKFILSDHAIQENIKIRGKKVQVEIDHSNFSNQKDTENKNQAVKMHSDMNRTVLHDISSTDIDKLSASEIVQKNLKTRNMNADQLKPNDYHEMIKEVNKIIRSQENVDSNIADNSRKYKCDICFASFKKSSNLSAHKRIHTNDKRYSCTMCDQRFYVRSKLQAHLRIHNNTRPFVCNICNKGFRENAVLKNHMATHEGKKQFYCDLCDKNFFRKSKLDLHMKTHFNDKPYTCEHCGKSFAVIYYYRRHVKKHASEKEFKCSICNKGFHLKESYKFHLLSHDESKKKRCEVCSKTFIKDSQLKNHNCKGEISEATSVQYDCDHCGNTFNSKSLLKIHQKEHNGENIYKCEICSKQFVHEYMLKRHLVVHSYKKPFKCTICNAEFGWASSIRSHIRNMHKEKLGVVNIDNQESGQSEKSEDTKNPKKTSYIVFPAEYDDNSSVTAEKYKNPVVTADDDIHVLSHTDNALNCSVCYMQFDNKELLHNHTQIHKQENGLESSSFVCQICKEIVAENEYETHTLNHTENSFSCKLCHQSFDHEQFLKNHRCPLKNQVRTKYEIKTVKCDKCKKEIPESDRESHMLVHVRYPFTCSFCNMNFERENYLQNHLKIHEGNNPYRCNLCGEKFATAQLLTSHRMLHEEEQSKPQQCPDCGRRFRHKTDLKLHRRTHTGEKPYECDQCEEHFARKDYLKKHVQKAHGSIENVQCVSCLKMFCDTYKLTRHIREYHIKDKPFMCKICDKKFSHQYEMNKHMKSHEISMPFKCTGCSNAFSKRKLLNRHFNKEHPHMQMKSEVLNKFILYVESEDECSDETEITDKTSEKKLCKESHLSVSSVSENENNTLESVAINTMLTSKELDSHARNIQIGLVKIDTFDPSKIESDAMGTDKEYETKKLYASVHNKTEKEAQIDNEMILRKEIQVIETDVVKTDQEIPNEKTELHEVEPTIEIPMDVFVQCQNSSVPVEYNHPVTGTIYKILPPPKQGLDIENVMEIQTLDAEEIIFEQVQIENEVSVISENTNGFFTDNTYTGTQDEHSYVKANNI